MKPSDDRLKELIKEAYGTKPEPGFDQIWAIAKKRNLETGFKSKDQAWRWALGPVVAVGLAVAIAMTTSLLVQPPRQTSKETFASKKQTVEPLDLNGIEDLKPWSAPLDRIFSGPNLLPLDGLLEESGESPDTDVGENNEYWSDTYRSFTDPLLEIETVAMNMAEERSLQ